VDGAAFTEIQFNAGALPGSTLDYLVLEIAQCIFFNHFLLISYLCTKLYITT
jgi:hypothetical protein